MDMRFTDTLNALENLEDGMFGQDFLLTWEKTAAALRQVLLAAEALKDLHRRNRPARCFDSGLAVSIFRDNSTRTRFSFASACDFLGLGLQDLDERRSQIAHGETVRETATMISFLTEVIGIRDDIYMGAGNRFMRQVAAAVTDSHTSGVLHQRPMVINLQCDLDHPTQTLADLLHLKTHFGSLAALRGKKIAMSWAYSPSYGKPLSVPQGIVALMARFGMHVCLAHPPGYQLTEEALAFAQRAARKSGGRFSITDSMADAFADADVVYPKSWAPFAIMEKRTEMLTAGNTGGLAALEKEALDSNARHASWQCTPEMMGLTRGGRALYMHCLPADISGVSCTRGEVEASVFEKYRLDTYRQAAFKPFVIAAMILCSRFRHPARVLETIGEKPFSRCLAP